MKTVLVIYTDLIISSKKEIAKAKKYAFNTSSELKEGDILSSPEYTSRMQVVKVLDKSFKYYNSLTRDLSDDYTSTAQWEIRNLVVREEESEVVYAHLVKE